MSQGLRNWSYIEKERQREMSSYIDISIRSRRKLAMPALDWEDNLYKMYLIRKQLLTKGYFVLIKPFVSVQGHLHDLAKPDDASSIHLAKFQYDCIWNFTRLTKIRPLPKVVQQQCLSTLYIFMRYLDTPCVAFNEPPYTSFVHTLCRTIAGVTPLWGGKTI